MTNQIQVLDATPSQYAIVTPRSVGELFPRFVSFIDAKPKTVETYTRAMRQLLRFLNDRGITAPTRETLIEYREHLRASHKPTTVQNYMQAAKRFFGWMSVEGLYADIGKGVKGVKLDREHKKDYLSARQVKAILAGIDRSNESGIRDYALFALLVGCGLRTIEVSRANIEDLRVKGESTVLYLQGKGHDDKADFVIVSEPVEKALRAYLATREKCADTDPLFVSTSNNSRGARLTTRSISGIAKAIMVNSGYQSDRLTAHSLRHTAVTLAIKSGRSLAEAQQFARHKDISTTQVYNHSLEKMENKCSASVANAIFWGIIYPMF